MLSDAVTADQAGYDRGAVRDALLNAVSDIEETLLSVADEAQRIGTMPEAGWRAMHDSGLFRMKAPRSLGGTEADPVTQTEVFERVSYLDSTAGWTLFVGAGTLAIISGWLPDAAMSDFLIDGRLPRVTGGLAPTGNAEPVDGGYRLTGRWQFGSGSEHAEWMSGNAFIVGQDPPKVLSFAFPRSVVTIHGNWQVGGLKGTGSSDFSVTDHFVPNDHTFNNFEPAMRGGALYRIGLPGLVANEHAGFALGVARRALDEVTELAKSKSRGYVLPQGVASRGVFQYELGKQDMNLLAARAGVMDAFEAIWQAASAGDPVTTGQQTAARCAAVHATEAALEACRFAFRYAGARSLYDGNVIERCLRDMQAGAQHGIVNDAAYEARGQHLLGLSDVAALS